jgi:prepilin-type N-terminal cleavage/methylation domain-containing protein
MKTRKKIGFTLIELLVVIAIIALLLSIVMPAMRRAKFIAKRVVCSSQIKQGTTAFLCYATTVGDGKLPLGAMGKAEGLSAYQKGQGWSQLDYIHATSWLPVKEYLEDARTMICNVSVPKERLQDENWTGEPYIPSGTTWNAYWIGYNYHGGHFAEAWPTPSATRILPWISPYKLTDSGRLPLLSDKICRSNNRDKTFIGHSPSGPLYGEINQNPNEISGAAGSGGNIGYMDGSVEWKNLDKMDWHHRAKSFTGYPIEPGSTILTGYW